MLALHYNHKVKEYSEMGIPTPDEMMVDIARCEATLPRNQICKIQTITIIRDKDVVESPTDDTSPLQQDIPNDPSNL